MTSSNTLCKKIVHCKAIPAMIVSCYMLMSIYAVAQSKAVISKKISPILFGLFFEDINYAADGGLYAELIQNNNY